MVLNFAVIIIKNVVKNQVLLFRIFYLNNQKTQDQMWIRIS